MGLISTVMGIFGKSDKAVDTGLDLIKMGAKGIDALWYTDEEKAENKADSAKLKFKWGELAIKSAETTIGENSQRSLSRRYLAWGVFSLGGFLTLYSLLFKTLAAFWHSEAFNDISNHALALLKVWWPIILAAGVFYFGAHLIGLAGKK
jgi:hypothetical protein